MAVSFWKLTSEEAPPNGVEVDTISPGGQQQTLKHHSNLWWLPDGSMYIYYTPLFWRMKED